MANKTILIKAKPALGFNFDYLLCIPDSVYNKTKVFLTVEVNNPYIELVSCSPDELIKDACSYLKWDSIEGLINKLGFPYLMPLFPRYPGFYTNALSRSVLLSDDEGIRRLDLQLIKMTENATTILKEMGINLEEKFILNGTSASGAFSNRFAVMHPELLKCVISGGQSYAIMPLKEYNGFKLTYPIGIYDLKEITGIDFKSEEYFALPQFIYEGDQDDANDTAKSVECMASEQASILYSLFGDLPKSARLKNQIKLFQELGYDNIDMRVYEGFGHKLQVDDLVKFINNIVTENGLQK